MSARSTITNLFQLYRQFFPRQIETVVECQKLGLKHLCNIYGDEIIHSDWCRSIWKLESGERVYCRELFDPEMELQNLLPCKYS